MREITPYVIIIIFFITIFFKPAIPLPETVEALIFFTERLQILRRCARPSSDRFFVIAHRFCRSCSPSAVDSERYHLLPSQQSAEWRFRMRAHAPVLHACSWLSFRVPYNYLTCVLFSVESWLRETTQQRLCTRREYI